MLRVRYQDDLLHIHVEAATPRDRIQGANERLDLLRVLMEEKIGESLVIDFEVTPVDILHFQSPPELETTTETALPANQIK